MSSSENSYYTETKNSQLICTSNQFTGFYMTRFYWMFLQNLLICIKKCLNNEGGRHLSKSKVTPVSYVSPDMSLLQDRRNGF